MPKWIVQLHKAYMERRKTRLKYLIDKEAMITFIDASKPEQYIIGNDRQALDTMINHFTTAGYCVIVRD